MRKFLLAALTAAPLAAPAQAADMPVKTPAAVVEAAFNWSGLYFGVNGGWAHGKADWLWLNALPTEENQRIDGGVIGGHAGYQRQFGRFVLGAEVNFLGARIDASAICNVNAAFRCESEVQRLWTVGPRLGVAFNNVLVYGTGGFASAQLATTAIAVVTGATFWTSKLTHNGWFGGGGVEYGITPNVIAGVEALYVDLQSKLHVPRTGTGVVVFADRRDIDLYFAIIRARLTFLFGPGLARP
jgi:outer membrane immunogenic protein